jgi:cell division protein FtsA
VVTGGGAQLKHVTQLIEYITGMDTRIGYPNEHLGQGSDDIKSPMYATGVGLVIRGLQEYERNLIRSKGKSLPAEEEKPRHKGGWFKGFFEKSKDFFADEKEDPNL